MEDSTLVRVAITIALLGLVGIVLYASRAPSVDFYQNPNTLDREVKLIGRVVNVIDKEKVAFLELSHPELTQVVVFKPGNLSIEPNATVEVTGVLEPHNGELGLVAYRIAKLGHQ